MMNGSGSSYSRVEGRRWSHVFRGFRVSPRRRRFSVQTAATIIKNRVVRLLRRVGRWKSPYVRKGSACVGNNKRRGLIVPTGTVVMSNDCRLRSLARSNSFYSEAIADCLDFIKRSSVTMEECISVTGHQQR